MITDKQLAEKEVMWNDDSGWYESVCSAYDIWAGGVGTERAHPRRIGIEINQKMTTP